MRNVGARALGDALGDRFGRFGHGSRLDQHGELVAAEAGHGVAGAGGGAEAFGDSHEQAVAGRMPEAVVDRLEVVEVQEQHGDRIGAPVAAVHGMGEPVQEQRPVGQAGEGVVERLVVELLAPVSAAR